MENFFTLRNLRQFTNQFMNFLKSPVNSNWTPKLKEGDDYRNSIVIRKRNHHLYVYDDNGNVVYHIPVATGRVSGQRQQANDSRTPVGSFSINSHTTKADTDTFGHNLHYGLHIPAGENYPAGSGFAIHGDANNPDSIGTNASHGCIRCNNGDLEKLHEILGGRKAIGKKVYILDEKDNYKSGGTI